MMPGVNPDIVFIRVAVSAVFRAGIVLGKGCCAEEAEDEQGRDTVANVFSCY